MTSNYCRILVYTGGNILNEPNGPRYEGGSTIILPLQRGIGVDELRNRIRCAADVGGQHMKMTFRYPVLSYPHTHYTYAALDLVDDSMVDIMFEVSQTISGYTPEIFVVAKDGRRRKPIVDGEITTNIADVSTSHGHVDAEAGDIFLESMEGGPAYNEDHPTSSATSPPSLDEFRMCPDGTNIEEGDTEAFTSEEDVDVGLEADLSDDEDNDLYVPQSHIFTQDTWTNIVDPSPTLPDMDVVGWDAVSELGKGIIFHSKGAVQRATKMYNMSRNHTAKVLESNTTTISYACSNQDPCSWRLRAHSKPKEGGIWIISKYNGPHTCMTGIMTCDHPMLDASFILTCIRPEVHADPAVKIKSLMATIKKECVGFEPSYAKCWAAKQKAIAELFGDWDESYNRLGQFFIETTIKNPGTVWRLQTEDEHRHGGGGKSFDRVFWAFGPCLEAFRHCRPVLCADGTFMSGKYKHTLLIAIAQDADNMIIPVCFAIVKKEDTETWGWFLQQIRTYVTDMSGLCLISDRHPGLLAYLKTDPEWRPPRAYHRYCSRHVGANFTKNFNQRVGNQVKVCAKQLQVCKFNRLVERIRPLEKGAVGKAIDEMDREKWALAFDGARRYGSMTTNIAECFNGVMKDARHLPITAAVTVTFYKCVAYFCGKGEIATKKQGLGQVYSDFAVKILGKWCDKARFHTVVEYSRADAVFEVISAASRTVPHKGNRKQTVRLRQQTCTCQKWEQWKIPCSHAIACCNKMSMNHLLYVHPMWTVARNVETYCSQIFYPLRDMAYWPPYTGNYIFPPTQSVRRKGRSRTRRFRNEMDWQESRPSEVQTCKICGQSGHNRRTCPVRRLGPGHGK